jgi:hypothetical protein
MPLVVLVINTLPATVCLNQSYLVYVANSLQHWPMVNAFGSILKLCILAGCFIVMLVVYARGKSHSRFAVDVCAKSKV